MLFIKEKSHTLTVGDIFWHSPSNNVVIDINTLPADGRELSRTEYSELFERIGTRYGAGDGSTTFNVPNLLHRFAEGGTWSELGTYREAGLPNITGKIGDCPNGSTQGCFTRYGAGRTGADINDSMDSKFSFINFDASRSSSIYGNSSTVQPNSVLLLPLIIVKSNTLVTYCFKRTV